MIPPKPIPTDTPLGQLIADALRHLEQLGYPRNSIRQYRSTWRQFLELAKTPPIQAQLSEELIHRFFTRYGLSLDQLENRSGWWTRHLHRALKMLRQFALHGYLQRRYASEKVAVPSTFESLLNGYVEYAAKRLGNQPRGLRHRRKNLAAFLQFVSSKGVTTVDRVTAALLSDFIASRVHLNRHVVAKVTTDLRSFLRFLLVRGLLQKDLTSEVPKIPRYSDAHIPSTWKPEEVANLLSAVDRASPKGKRDYAVLLLAARLGMRAGDIRALRLEHLQWDQGVIKFPQSKTGACLSLPLTEEVGQALIDYLRHGRPVSEHRQVFMAANAPFEPLSGKGALYHIIAFWRSRAGISKPRQWHRGLHSLRHTLATRLLEAGTPLPTISAILGHLSADSTRIYAKATIDSLRSVALDPDEVLHAS